MILKPNEERLSGGWVRNGQDVVADATSERIDWLVKHHLRRVAADASGWDTLYEDPSDGRLWVLTYPQSEQHGGGPQALISVTRQEWDRRAGQHPT